MGIGIFVVFISFVLSALPLYFAVKFLGGKTGIIKTIFIMVLSGFIISAIQFRYNLFGGILAFLVLVWIYHEAFRLKWWKAFFVWIVQFMFVLLLSFLFSLIFGNLGMELFQADSFF